MNRPRKLNWNEVYLWLGFGRHNQGRKIETFWKHLGGKKKECLILLILHMMFPFLEAADVSCNIAEAIWKLYLNTFQLIKMNLGEFK